MLNEKVKRIAAENHIKFPYEVMTLVYNTDNRVVATPMLKFYLSLGMVVDHIYYAIQYVKVSN